MERNNFGSVHFTLGWILTIVQILLDHQTNDLFLAESNPINKPIKVIHNDIRFPGYSSWIF